MLPLYYSAMNITFNSLQVLALLSFTYCKKITASQLNKLYLAILAGLSQQQT